MNGVPGEGQMGLSNEELWPQPKNEEGTETLALTEPDPVNEPAESEKAEEPEVAETAETDKDQQELAENLFWEVTSATIKDPFSDKEIKMGEFLDREFKNGWYGIFNQTTKWDRLGPIFSVISSRVGTPDRLQMLAEAYNDSPQIKRLEQKITEIRDEIYEIREKRFDIAADHQVEGLKHEILAIEEEISEIKVTHNELYHYLRSAAKDWQKKLEPRL